MNLGPYVDLLVNYHLLLHLYGFLCITLTLCPSFGAYETNRQRLWPMFAEK